MLTALNTFWSENLRFFASLLNLPLLDRLKLVLGDLGKRAAVTDSEGTILIPELFHEHLAEMIGCSRPMVSRMIAELVDAGLLARRGKQYVLLKNWDFDMDPRQSKFVPRQPLPAAPATLLWRHDRPVADFHPLRLVRRHNGKLGLGQLNLSTKARGADCRIREEN